MAERRDPEDDVVRKQEEAAAAEAGRIGGRSGMEGMDEAERASAEHGGGQAEGFEQTEELLKGQAGHGDTSVDPLAGAEEPAEEEQDPATYGDADELESTETDEDTQGTPGDLDHSADEDKGT
jgi:hypothetical protein